MIKESKLYRVPEVCEILGITRGTLYRWIDEGRIKAIPHTKKQYRRILGKNLIAFIGGSNENR